MAGQKLLSRRAVPRTLRGRLIAGLVTLLAVACATVGLVTYLAVQRSLSGELNNNLQTATSSTNYCLDNHGDGDGDIDDHGALGAAAGNQSPQNGQGQHPPTCPGLGPGTFVARYANGLWYAFLITPDGSKQIALTAADKSTLGAIAPHPQDGPAPTYNRQLESANGGDRLTVVADPSGATYITGLPTAGMNDVLSDVALAEAAIFGAVLLLAGVLGTVWVRLSLRPLRRVAATAAQVAELPLESGEVELPSGVPDTDPVTETGQVGLAFNRMLGHAQ